MAGPDEFFRQMMGRRISRFHKDGVASSVTVIENPEVRDLKGQKGQAIFINGKSDSSTSSDIYTLKLSAHLPAILASQRRNVMVIGLGTGITAGELILYKDVERVDIAEISETVVEALPCFSRANNSVHKNPKLKVHIGDAFRILGRTRDQWDIIISEPSNPWVTGVDLLFTREFYALVKKHLSHDGILLQWVQIYDADIQMVGMIMNTVMQEFRGCHVFVGNSMDLLILATDKEFTSHHLEIAENVLRENPAVRASLEAIHLSSLDAILLRELWSPSLVRSFSGFGIQTMDYPRLHYMAGKMFFTGGVIQRSVLLNPVSISHLSEYLLPKRHSRWGESPLESHTLESFLKSTTNLVSADEFPMTPSVRLKAYLSDPSKFTLGNKEKQFFMVDLIPLITGKTKGKDAWLRVGLQSASYRKKGEVMMSHITQHRNWIVPYPIDGLKALLRQGIISGTDPYERNWCALKTANILISEGADRGRVNSIIEKLNKDESGRLLLQNGDEGLLEAVERWLKKGST